MIRFWLPSGELPKNMHRSRYERESRKAPTDDRLKKEEEKDQDAVDLRQVAWTHEPPFHHVPI